MLKVKNQKNGKNFRGKEKIQHHGLITSTLMSNRPGLEAQLSLTLKKLLNQAYFPCLQMGKIILSDAEL